MSTETVPNRRSARAAVVVRDEALPRASTARRARFAAWYRQRPLIGGLLTILAGIEMFLSSQLDLGNMHIQVGIEGLQATILPILMVLLGTLAIVMPAHRVFYGIISLVLAVYSLVGVNLGGFFIGMLLGMIGGVMVVSWMPRRPALDGVATADVTTVDVSTADITTKE
ncbi:DUF6114 domain-containing protein [Subtercola frigoramans]|uniref:Uncharacterized protein n=1 Tax=Subtercola frigoramans TaxID=120298 RepID=A0ABS2L7J7_9MICO|nr:DUF6114 domain-containing protein [Subtercola frigoramans]MBM7473070.1 hypothetical protein [Subtercola frigoramans]